MAVAEKRLLLIVMSFVLLFGFKLSARAEESAAEKEYIIYVNRTENCVTVMEQLPDGTSAVAKVMACSCGRAGHETPEGTFRTSDYYDWRLLIDGSYGRYAVRFNKGILFHSVPYTQMSPDALEWDQYNLLGENASLGCVRLAVEDVKWIHDNCKPGTQVTVYSGEEIVGGVTKPDSLKIAEDSPNRGWDPTDLTPGNPWLDPDSELSYPIKTVDTVDYAARSDSRVSSPIRTLKTFDYVAYADRYEDVREAFGYDKAALYNHYITYGISEGRIAKFASSAGSFNYTAYADRYEDVREAFGYDREALYNHYITYGISEGRIAEFY